MLENASFSLKLFSPTLPCFPEFCRLQSLFTCEINPVKLLAITAKLNLIFIFRTNVTFGSFLLKFADFFIIRFD